jgi:adenine-specific DNA-methyltransferase
VSAPRIRWGSISPQKPLWLIVTLDDLGGKVTVSVSGDRIPEARAEPASSKVTMSPYHVSRFTRRGHDEIDGIMQSSFQPNHRPGQSMPELCKTTVTIDDNEAHYLKVLCDEIFGRANFVATCVWEKDKGGRGDADISLSHDNILVYARDRISWSNTRNLMPRSETQLGRFKNPDNDPRGPWRQGDDGTAKSGTAKQRFPVELPSGRMVTPPPGRYWAFSPQTLAKAREEGRAYFGVDGDRLPIIKRYLSEVREGVAPRTWWSADEVGTNQQAKRDHLNKLLPDVEPFATPKPEGLIHRILYIATNPSDLVLDSFAGGGTTGAVAHKMGRRWIMVELGDHAQTHIVPRLRKVIDGADPGGVTKAVDWPGGGGFRYYNLAPSLLEQDRWGRWVINKQYNAAMLAEALCKLEGFVYAPSDTLYWQHGYSTERDFIYVTTASLTHDQLQQLADEVGSERSLLVLCAAFQGRAEYPNLTIKKIPRQVLSRCEWGHDDYSLRVENLPKAPGKPVQQTLFDEDVRQ